MEPLAVRTSRPTTTNASVIIARFSMKQRDSGMHRSVKVHAEKISVLAYARRQANDLSSAMHCVLHSRDLVIPLVASDHSLVYSKPSSGSRVFLGGLVRGNSHINVMYVCFLC